MFQGWNHNFQRQVFGLTSNNVIQVIRQDGSALTFTLSGSNWIPDADINDQLVQLNSGTSSPEWQFTRAADDSLEFYDVNGNLTSVVQRDGKSVALTYSTGSTPLSVAPSANYLLTATDNFGRTIGFSYSASVRATTLTDAAGQTYVMAADTTGNLTSITYPDTYVAQYVYNESGFAPSGSNLLTGVIDENSSRFSTYEYNAAALASEEFLAGPVAQYAATYTTDGSGNIESAAVSDPLGTNRAYGVSILNYTNRVASLTQPNEAGGTATSAVSFDINGNVASQTDFNGNLSCYVFDLTRNLQTGRVEGMAPGSTCPANIATYATATGTVERKILTQNHPIWHLPAKVAEPLRITTYVYNGDGGAYCAPTSAMSGSNPIGVLCSKTEQATTDATGSLGFSATVTGSPREWQYTYNQYGQVLTMKDPLNNTTTYAYYASTDTAHSPPWYYMGDLNTVKDALNHTTTYTKYDGNGRLLSMTDPNGVITTMTYKPRGWLATKVVTQPSGGTETTTYGYDNVGQMTQVTLPDSTYIKYTYDAAHRLYEITDSAGDTITYTLDNMGNRTAEATKDPSGTLTRNVARIFDALNRLSSVTGASQ